MDLPEKITWKRLIHVLEEWIGYGDDPFEDAYSEIHEQWVRTNDATQKKKLEDIMKVMDVLRRAFFR